MKKIIAILTVAAFAAVSYAGDKAASPKAKTASAEAKSACSAEGACCAKEQVAKKDSCCALEQVAKKESNSKKIVMSPKAAGQSRS
jgi:hypothetical protein